MAEIIFSGLQYVYMQAALNEAVCHMLAILNVYVEDSRKPAQA